DARPAKVDVSAPHGKAGTWLLDPYDILISDNVDTNGVDANFTAGQDGSTIASSTLIDALSGGSNVVVQTGIAGDAAGQGQGNITLNSAHIDITSATPGSLTLTADGGISMSSSSITSVKPMPVSLLAARAGGAGSILLGASTISTGGGDLTLGGFYDFGTLPSGGTFTGAARAYSGWAIELDGSSVLDAGAGNIRLSGVGSAPEGGGGGVLIGAGSKLNAKQILLQGTDTGYYGSGVEIDGATLSASGSVRLQGWSQYGTGVSTSSDATITVAQPDSSGPHVIFDVQGAAGGGYGGTAISMDATTVSLSSPQAGVVAQLVGQQDVSFSNTSIQAQAGTSMNVSVQAGTINGGGTIWLSNTSIASGGGDITLGGPCDCGIGPNGTSFGGAAAVGNNNGGWGISLQSGTVLDGGGTGTIKLSGVGYGGEGGGGIQISNSTLTNAGQIVVLATDNGYGSGVYISDSSLDSKGSMTISGYSEYGWGVDIFGTTSLRVTAAGASSPASTLLIAGQANQGGVGISFDAGEGGGLTIQGGANTAMQISGWNGPYIPPPLTESSPQAPGTTISVSGATIDNSQGSGLLIEAHALDGDYRSSIAISNNALIKGSSATTSLQGADDFHIIGSQITAPGLINIRADSVTIDSGASIVNTNATPYAAPTDAIVISGNDGNPLSTFYNYAGGTALQVDATTKGRWIIWAYDITDGESVQFGGLAYDFTQHGAQQSGAWSGYAGNAFVSYQSQYANAYGDYFTRPYDGTTDAAPTNVQFYGSTFATGTLQTGSYVHFASKDVGYGTLTIDPAGVDFRDSSSKPVYGLQIDSGVQGQITPRAISASVAVADKVYDTTTAASMSVTFSNLVAGESLTGTATGGFVDPHVGQGKTVSAELSYGNGADGTGLLSNYAITGPTAVTGNITPATLLISGLTAQNKVYDTTVAATLAGTAQVTALGSDQVSLAGTAAASFADKNVGTGKAVSLSGLTLAGASAGDYVLGGPATALSANITPAPLPGTGLVAQNKVYDASTLATLLNTGQAQVLGSDQVTVSGGIGQFADKNAGTGKAVSVSGITLSGPDAGNYSVGPVALSADITPRAVAVSGLGVANKVYDTTTTATLTGTAGAALLGGDGATVSVGGAQFADKNVGSGKPVSVTGLALTGPDAGNYVIVAP
uniref:beta strand repeat-containing protein n=1 Tax=Pelomonas sp. KK5 TaxID=1855730 RepID=UPI001301C76A